MLKLNYEFRKGIFFIRFIGNLNKKTLDSIDKELTNMINENKFKYIVVNTNYLSRIDLDGLNYITKIYYMATKNKSNLIICDKNEIIQTLLNHNIPSINNELEIL